MSGFYSVSKKDLGFWVFFRVFLIIGFGNVGLEIMVGAN